MNHFLACGWYAVGNFGLDPSWVQVLEGKDLQFRYITSLHWSLTQFTPASMEVFPRNSTERSFAVIVILAAMLTFSSFVSSITSGMTRLRMLKSEKAKQQYLLRSFLKENKIPPDLSMRIQ